MTSRTGYIRKSVLCVAALCWLFGSAPARSEGAPIYYDTFYEDYYKAFPDARPAIRPAASAGAYSAAPFQAPVASSAAQYYTAGVERRPLEWEISLGRKMGYTQFMFETDVGSRLNWDQLETTEMKLDVSRDFIFRNRQYVFKAAYGTGSGSAVRTYDEDLFNEAHTISMGSGSVDLRSWSVAFGMRNLFRLAGFDATPYLGYKKDRQSLKMAGHATPAPFFLERQCYGTAEYTTAGQQICQPLNIQTTASAWGLTLGVGDLYYRDADGNEVAVSPVSGDLTIPSYVVGADLRRRVNLYYGRRIPDEDFCYYTTTSLAQGYEVCLKKGVNSRNLIAVLGGASFVSELEGTTHDYDVEWTGPYLGLQLERALSPLQVLTLYAEVSRPSYKAVGDWPFRSEWEHPVSFIDKGGSAWGFLLDLTWRYRALSNMELVAGGNFEYIKASNVDTHLYTVDWGEVLLPGSVIVSRWKSFALSLGVAFRL